MNDPTSAEQCRAAINAARVARLAREGSAEHQRRLRERDDAYERRAPARRAEARRLRLADGLPPEMGGRRPAALNAQRAAACAAADHLREAGLFGQASARVLRHSWREAS